MARNANGKTFPKVIDNIKQMFSKADKTDKKHWVEWLNTSLDELRNNDFFGTEAQLDPRGDGRDDD